MKIKISEEQLVKLTEIINSEKIECNECGWSWRIDEGGDDLLTCHKCGNINEL